MFVAMTGDDKKKLIDDFLKKFNQLELKYVSVEDIHRDEIDLIYRNHDILPMYEIKCKIDDQDVVVTYCQNKNKVFTYQVKFKDQTIQFYSDGYLKINGKFINKNFGDNGKNGDNAFFKEFKSIDTKFQSFVNYIKSNTSKCKLDDDYQDTKFTQHEMRRKLREDYDKTSYKYNNDGTFDVEIGNNQYKTAFIHFQPTVEDLHLNANHSHDDYKYSDLSQQFVNDLWSGHKKKSATMLAFNNDKNIVTHLHSVNAFSVGMMFNDENDIFGYSKSDCYFGIEFFFNEIQENYHKTQRSQWGVTDIFELAKEAFKDKNLKQKDKYQLLFANLENRNKTHFDTNKKDKEYNRDFYFKGDEAIMITKGINNPKFNLGNFCIQMFFTDCQSSALLNTRFSEINKKEPIIKWDKSFEYDNKKYPNCIKPEVEKIVKQNAELGNTHIWILDYGNQPYTMIKVENSVDAVKEYFDSRYKHAIREMKEKRKIYDPFIPKEEQDDKKINNKNESKIDNQKIDNISNLQSINRRNEITEPIKYSNSGMSNTQQKQNNRHPLNDVCGHNLSWLDCCNICG